MANAKVLAGDWAKGPADYSSTGDGWLHMLVEQHVWKKESMSLKDATFTEATEENVKQLGGAAAFGLVGASLLGPAGLLAGILLGGNKKKHVVIYKWPDGRKVMLEVDSKIYKKMIVESF